MGFYLIMIPALLLIATAYASVGLGGGTAYLSVLSFWNSDPALLRPIAWALNVVVATIGAYNFYKKGHLDIRAIWPYLVTGLVGAALGAAVPIDAWTFRILLAATLTILALRMILTRSKNVGESEETKTVLLPIKMLLGFLPGVISGIVGIGGGIILGPIILAFGLLPVKRSAALTSLYIWVCSAGALATHFSTGGTLPWGQVAVLSAVVTVGGYFGSRYGAGAAKPITLQRIFGVIVLVAAANLIYKIVAAL